MTSWAPARLLRASRAAQNQVWLEVAAPDGFAAAHTRPGQFCKIRIGGDEGIFAMLTVPGDAPRFLVRVGNSRGGKAADALATLEPGAAIEMSMPGGGGFGLERVRGMDLRFVATGTGVAPVCAAIEFVLQRRSEYGAISLDHGIRTAAHLAIAEPIKRWRSAGVVVRIAYSTFEANGGRPPANTVQQSLRTACPDLSGATVIGVGQSSMLASLRDVIGECGGNPDALLTNS